MDLTTESEHPEASGRKFDDVASLFGSIVPAPGSPIRPFRPFKPLSIPSHETSTATIVPPARSLREPLADPEPEFEPESEFESEFGEDDATHIPPVEPGSPAELRSGPLRPSLPPGPVAGRPADARPRPVEIPWPDAFEPRPNYRKPEPRNWSWLLLIPIGLMAAFGISMLDTRALKAWIDINLLHRTPIAAISFTPLLPAPFRDAAVATETPTALPPDLTPALPTSPVPVPPGTEVSPPPDAVETAKPPVVHITIQYHRGIPGADGEARRMAALLQSTGGSVELRPNATTVKAPTIMFYNAADRPSAAALTLILANEAATWTVRQGAASGGSRTPPGTIDIWMP